MQRAKLRTLFLSQYLCLPGQHLLVPLLFGGIRRFQAEHFQSVCVARQQGGLQVFQGLFMLLDLIQPFGCTLLKLPQALLGGGQFLHRLLSVQLLHPLRNGVGVAVLL